MEADEQEQRARIAGWVKEGRTASKKRKQRNHALINLGLGALASIKAGEKELVDFLRHIPDSKHDIIRDLLDDGAK